MSKIEIRGLPGILGELVREGFPNAALALLKERGGQLLYVPRNSKRGSLHETIGAEAADYLSRNYAGLNVLVPTAKRAQSQKARIIEMTEEGRSIREIVLETGVSARWVSMVRAVFKPSPERAKDSL